MKRKTIGIAFLFDILKYMDYSTKVIVAYPLPVRLFPVVDAFVK